MAFSNVLKYLRHERKIKQEELAKILQTSAKSVSHWETGYSEPSIAQLIALADYFGVTVDELIDREV